MLKKTLTALSVSLVAAASYAGTAPAPGPKQPVEPIIEAPVISYSNFSLAYSFMTADIVGLDADAHGIAAGVEFSPIEHLYLAARGSWHDVDVDAFGIVDLDFDYWTANLGIGGYLPITNNIHFVTEVGASYANLELNGVPGTLETDEWGVYVMPHFRAKWGNFETHVGVIYNSNELAISEWTGFAKLLFEVAPQVDLFVGATVGFDSDDDDAGFEDVWGVQAGVRFKF
jgi:hypothetical protein